MEEEEDMEEDEVDADEAVLRTSTMYGRAVVFAASVVCWCAACKDLTKTERMRNGCPRRCDSTTLYHNFYGVDALDKFVHWLMHKDRGIAYAFAHNFRVKCSVL